MSASGMVGRGESSGVGTTSFRCNITNHYFYFRFIAFVNCDISAIWRKLQLRRVPNHTWQNIEAKRLLMIARKHTTALVCTALGLTLQLTACSKLPKVPLKTAT